MAKLGSRKRPAIVRVGTKTRADEIMYICESHDWRVIIGIEPDKPEDISDVRKLMNRSGFLPVNKEKAYTVSGNDYCPCGSGLKFKKCCMMKQLA